MKLTMRIEGADLDRIIQAVEELDEIALTHIWQSNQPDEGDLEV
jgi:hypothetical protein